MLDSGLWPTCQVCTTKIDPDVEQMLAVKELPMGVIHVGCFDANTHTIGF